MSEPLVISTDKGLYCPPGGFFIDPWKSVKYALVTHAHSDHARIGSDNYLTAEPGLNVLRSRLDQKAVIETIPYGQKLRIKDVTVSFHSAGHVLGSAQIRLEHKGRIWVVSGDYKTQADPTCASLEIVPCHTFITESTFGLPVYRWPETEEVFADINAWWHKNSANGRASVLFAYSFGKAQRILSSIESSIGPIFVHGAVHKLNEQYLSSGVFLPKSTYVKDSDKKTEFSNALIIAPPAAYEGTWCRRFGDYSSAFASGWMRVRGNKRRQSVDRGFVLSDHADWNGLLSVIEGTAAEEVIVTHGFSYPLIKYLKEKGKKARGFKTAYSGEGSEMKTPDENPESKAARLNTQENESQGKPNHVQNLPSDLRSETDDLDLQGEPE